MGYPTPPGDEIDQLLRAVRDLAVRIAELERPTGTQTAQALKQLQDLVAGLVNATNGVFTGYVTAGSYITAGTDITTTSGYLYSPAGYAFDITYTRRAAWLGNDGRLAWASSSIAGKQVLETMQLQDMEQAFKIISRFYQRKPELAKQAADPDYHVATEWGAIAEELHALGWWQLVIYEWDVEYTLVEVVDENGNPIVDENGETLKERIGGGRRIGDPRPVGIHYEMLGLLAIEMAKHVRTELSDLRSEHLALVDELRARGVID